jgi:hypothetical protein
MELKLKKGSLTSKLADRFKNKFESYKDNKKKGLEDKRRVDELSQGIDKRTSSSGGSVVRSTSVTKPKFKKTENKGTNYKTISIRKN